MSAFWAQLSSLLTSPAGLFFYSIMILLSIGGALAAAIAKWATTQALKARRRLLGLAVLLGSDILLMALTALGLLGVIHTATSLPPIDRAFAIMSIVWMTWLWAFPEASPSEDTGAVALSLAVAAAAGISLLSWNQQPASVSYNQTVFDTIWLSAAIGLGLVAAVILLQQRRPGLGYGLAFLFIILLGYAWHLFLREQGDFSGIVHLAYLVAYPLVLTLPWPLPAPPSTLAPKRPEEGKPISRRKPYGAEPETVEALLQLAASSSAADLGQTITRAVALTMLADLAFLVSLTEDKEDLTVTGGYDLIQEESLPAQSLNKTAIPMLMNAIQRAQPLRLPASGTSPDVRALAPMLGQTAPSNLLSVPIVTTAGESWGALIVLSPYSKRTWSADDQAFLANVAGWLVPVLEHHKWFSGPRPDDRQAELELEAELPEIAGQPGANSSEVAGQSQPPLTDFDGELLDANANISARPSGKRGSDAMASTLRELRQPMFSILVQTDLLLDQSGGPLEPGQRRFVERIKSSALRITDLIDGLDQQNPSGWDSGGPSGRVTDLNPIIDRALARTSAQVRDKRIAIHLDLPKGTAWVGVDPTAAEQILIHLLQNAGSATPVEGSIGLKVQPTIDRGLPCVTIHVSDTGGGIPAQDLTRVFSSLYRSDNMPISGIGDTGVGLSLAKSLAEAQNGRIWVESQPGVGSTFSVLLPSGSQSAPQAES